jgi:hypothetical protein
MSRARVGSQGIATLGRGGARAILAVLAVALSAAGCGGGSPATGGTSGKGGGAGHGTAGAAGQGTAGGAGQSTAGAGGEAGAAGVGGGSGQGGAGQDGGAGQTGGSGGPDGSAGSSVSDGSSPDGDAAPNGDGSVTTLPGSPLTLCGRSLPLCDVGSACVISETITSEGHCLKTGAPAGSCNAAAPFCSDGLACVGSLCVPSAAAGQPCGSNAGCVAGTSCVTPASGASGACVALGKMGTPCGASAPRCDTGLGCSANRTCQPLAATATTCSATAGCADGSNCFQYTFNQYACIPDGGSSGACRTTAPACNAGLACDASSQKCTQALSLNSNCGGIGTNSNLPCADGLYCTDTYAGGKCLTQGAQSAPCRSDGSCDTGLTCSISNTCLAAAAVADDGASCATLACKRGSSCLTGTQLCAPNGSVGASCRPISSPQRCDANLVCNGSICVAPVALGQPCTYNRDVCASSGVCPAPTTAMPTPVCIAPGTSGAPCRKAPAPACDTGLDCYTTSAATLASCQPATLTVGMACSTALTATNRCVPGTACVGGTCVAPGKLGAACLPHEPKGACDVLLGCAVSQCASGIADGATCDPKSTTSICGLPDICVTTGAGSKCVAVTYSEQAIAGVAFVDACTAGNHVPLKGTRAAGHSASAINIPFAFRLWGSDYTTVWPSTRGALVFGAEPRLDDGVGNGYLPTDGYGPLVAPFWDQILLGDAPASDICFSLAGSAPNRQFVVEWAHAGHAGVGDVDLTFEVVLHETTMAVDFVYGPLAPAMGADAGFADGSRAAVGLQSGYDGVAVRHAGTVPAGGALRYTPN